MRHLLSLSFFISLLLASALPCNSADNNNSVQALQQLSLGEHLSAISKYREALPYYYRAIHLNPTLPDPYWRIGDNLVELDEPQKAVTALTKAISLNPKNPYFFESRSKAYFCASDFPHALSDIDHAITLDPSNAFFIDKKADIESTSGNKEKALADYTRAIELSAKEKAKATNADQKQKIALVHNLACKDRGNLYRATGKYELAIKDYNEALSSSDGGYLRDHVLVDRAECYDKLGKHDLAEKSRKLAEQSSHQYFNEMVK